LNEAIQTHKTRENSYDVHPSTVLIFLLFQNLFVYSCLYSLDFFTEYFQNTEPQTSPRKEVKIQISWSMRYSIIFFS